MQSPVGLRTAPPAPSGLDGSQPLIAAGPPEKDSWKGTFFPAAACDGGVDNALGRDLATSGAHTLSNDDDSVQRCELVYFHSAMC